VDKQDRRPVASIQTRTFDFAGRMIRLHQYLEQHGGAGRTIAGQALRSGISIGASLEEADAAQSKLDVISKCNIALKEARETHYWLRLITSTNLAPPDRVAPLLAEANEIVAILSTIVRKSRTNVSNKDR
jgi:four helix bundle protein